MTSFDFQISIVQLVFRPKPERWRRGRTENLIRTAFSATSAKNPQDEALVEITGFAGKQYPPKRGLYFRMNIQALIFPFVGCPQSVLGSSLRRGHHQHTTGYPDKHNLQTTNNIISQKQDGKKV